MHHILDKTKITPALKPLA